MFILIVIYISSAKIQSFLFLMSFYGKKVPLDVHFLTIKFIESHFFPVLHPSTPLSQRRVKGFLSSEDKQITSEPKPAGEDIDLGMRDLLFDDDLLTV